MRANRQLAAIAIAACALASLGACSRDDSGSRPRAQDGSAAAAPTAPADSQVTIHGDDRMAGTLSWKAPRAEVDPEHLPEARKRAAEALEAGRLDADAGSAIPIYLAILAIAPEDAGAKAGLERARAALIAQGEAALADNALAGSGDDPASLRRAHAVAAVVRSLAPDAADVRAYLARVDQADRLWAINRRADRELAAGRLGEGGGGALAHYRRALALAPGQARATRGVVAVEAAMIRRAEAAAREGDFDAANTWLAHAAAVREDDDAVAAGRERVADLRRERISRLRDEGLVALQQRRPDLATARARLDDILRIADPGDGAAAELRARIDLVSHYGLFRPGQAFTDPLEFGARGPQMVVVPHGGFRMGAEADAPGTSDNERPAHYVRFDRGFAMSRTEVTVGEFRRFVDATGYEPTATRRGHSLMYDERSGNFVRRSGVDWRSTYDGKRASDDLPVLHVSQADAQAYADWLSAQSGERYRLPSEAEFEYALRAGGQGRYPWGSGSPPEGSGDYTGARDRSPGGRRWRNAFAGYGDGFWGPAPAGRFAANAYGLHDLAGNVSEWVADCWHEGYRRAPTDGKAWLNPGCRRRVVRGGAWDSAPEQVRSTWRTPVDAGTTNARIGFRVVRDL